MAVTRVYMAMTGYVWLLRGLNSAYLKVPMYTPQQLRKDIFAKWIGTYLLPRGCYGVYVVFTGRLPRTL